MTYLFFSNRRLLSNAESTRWPIVATLQTLKSTVIEIVFYSIMYLSTIIIQLHGYYAHIRIYGAY